MARLRIVTYNIAHGRGLRPIQGLQSRRSMRAHLQRIATLLRTLDADVVALQEIDERSRWAGNFDQVAYLQDHGGFEHALFGRTTLREGIFNLSYGNAFLSRHPFLEGEAVTFGRKTVGEKGFLFAEAKVGKRTVPLLNLHLNYRSRASRLDQVGQVFRYLEKQHNTRAPHWSVAPLVCGDFNTARHGGDATSSLLHELKYFGDYSLLPAGGNTFPSPLPTRALDFVMVPAGIQVERSEVVRSWLSDHRPVLVELTFPNA